MNDCLTDSKRRSVWVHASPIKSIISRFVNKTINFKNTTVKISVEAKIYAHNNTRVEMKCSGASGR